MNGRRKVTFTTRPPSPPSVQQIIAQWDFGDGGFGPIIALPAGSMTPNTQDHDYAPGHYTATLTVVSPTGCPPIAFTFDITCPSTPACDLDITSLTYTVGDCDASGKRLVTVTATLNSSNPADRFFWQFDPAIPATVSLPAAQGLTQTHLFDAPGTATATRRVSLTVVRGPDCVATEAIDVLVRGCGTACPEITALNIDTANAVCAPDGNHRTVILDATASASGISQYVWTFGDGTSATRPGNVGPRTTHDYAPGTYEVALRTTGPGSCSDEMRQQITVLPCCPNVTGISSKQAPCQRGTPTVQVDLSASLTGQATSFEWDFGDGTPKVTTTAPLAPVHSYAPGMYMVTVTASAPNCQSSRFSQAVRVAPCSDPTRTEIDVCSALLWVAIILSIIGFLLLIGGCILAQYYAYAGIVVQWVGAGFASAALTAFILWWIFCRFITPCRVLNAVYKFLLLMIAVVGVISAVIALIALLGNFTWLPCLLWTFAAWGQWGTAAALLYWLLLDRKCVTENNGNGTGSSSSGLTAEETFERPSAGRPLAQGSSSAQATARTLPPSSDHGAVAVDLASDVPNTAVTARERVSGLGDVIKNVTSALGIPPCAGCHQRAEQLNRAFPFGSAEPAAPPPPERLG